jgi:hypothetical protein
MYKAMEAAVIDSPRGKWTMSKSHNPVQDIYLRQVRKQAKTRSSACAAKALADSGAGCKMADKTCQPRQWEVFTPPIFLPDRILTAASFMIPTT